jgi:hypothetical protein
MAVFVILCVDAHALLSDSTTNIHHFFSLVPTVEVVKFTLGFISKSIDGYCSDLERLVLIQKRTAMISMCAGLVKRHSREV